MLVLAISGVLLGVAVPNLTRFMAHNRRVSTVNRLLATLNYARATSIRRGRQTVVCPIDTTGHCHRGTDWSHGWLVYMNLDYDYPAHHDANEPVLRRVQSGPHTQWLSNRSQFVMRPRGKRSTNGTLTVCSPGAPGRAVIINVMGRARSSRTRPGGDPVDCP